MMLKTKMERIINSSYRNIGGMVVIKNGEVLYENYYSGCNRESTFHIFSVTKSIVSCLIGIAMDQGKIISLDQKVLDFFPDYQIKRGEDTARQIKLKDMMTMTAPYKFKEEPYAEFFRKDDWVMAALDLLGGKDKIGEFRYAPVIGPDIFSGILVHTTNQSVLDFANEFLFGPLAIKIPNSIQFKDEKDQMEFYDAKNVKGWVADPKGVNTAGWGLNLSAMDMAKIGELYLNKGSYHGKQIVSSEWISESTKSQSRCDQFGLSYGYLWWIIDEKEHAYAAMGDGGNTIYVNEKKGIVISIASTFQKNALDRLKLIREYVEPVFE